MSRELSGSNSFCSFRVVFYDLYILGDYYLTTLPGALRERSVRAEDLITTVDQKGLTGVARATIIAVNSW
jgi:hypothetical protein